MNAKNCQNCKKTTHHFQYEVTIPGGSILGMEECGDCGFHSVAKQPE